MNGMPRAQEAHDCRDAGGRATQEQLPMSGLCQFCKACHWKCGAIVSVSHATKKIAAGRASHTRLLH